MTLDLDFHYWHRKVSVYRCICIQIYIYKHTENHIICYGSVFWLLLPGESSIAEALFLQPELHAWGRGLSQHLQSRLENKPQAGKVTFWFVMFPQDILKMYILHTRSSLVSNLRFLYSDIRNKLILILTIQIYIYLIIFSVPTPTFPQTSGKRPNQISPWKTFLVVDFPRWTEPLNEC